MIQSPIKPAASPCASCGRPAPLADTGGTLYLWWPAGHVGRKLLTAVRDAGLPVVTAGAAARAEVPVAAETLADLAGGLAAALTPVEAQAVRALFLPHGMRPGIEALGRVTTLARVAARSEAVWLDRLLAEDRLTSHFQPIVTTEGGSFAVEALVRGITEEGDVIGGGRIMTAARGADMLFPVDLAARACAVRTAAASGWRGRLFINFSPAAIYDPDHCLRSTVGLIEAAGIPPENIVFEVGEADSLESLDHLKNILRVYRAAGFKVALDDLGAGYASLNLLHEVRPDFVKLDMGLVQGVDGDAYKAAVLGGLLRMARELGIPTVCEGVETEAEAAWLRAAGADYLQGYLFGRPGPLVAPPTAG